MSLWEAIEFKGMPDQRSTFKSNLSVRYKYVSPQFGMVRAAACSVHSHFNSPTCNIALTIICVLRHHLFDVEAKQLSPTPRGDTWLKLAVRAGRAREPFFFYVVQTSARSV